MDEQRMNELAMEKARKKFYGHKKLHSKYTPRIPMSAEREYIRVTDAYMELLNEELKAELPKIKEVYKLNRDEKMRADGFDDVFKAVERVFNRIEHRLTAKVQSFGLRRKLESLANLNRKLTVREWKNAIRSTLGIDLREDYYNGDFFEQDMKRWVSDNVDLIKTIPHNSLGKMKEIIYASYDSGKLMTDMAKDIQKVYGIDKRHARFIARDQTAKLNAKMQRAQQLDAGIETYIWSTSGDERVRKSHKDLDGLEFSWHEAPLNSDGRACHPGEDFNCRCVPRPVFDKDTIKIPTSDMPYEENKSSTEEVKEKEQPITDLEKKLKLESGKRLIESAKRKAKTILNNSNGEPKMIEELHKMSEQTRWIADTSKGPYETVQKKLANIVYYNPLHKDFYNYDEVYAQIHELSHRVDFDRVESWKNEDFKNATYNAFIVALKNKYTIAKWFEDDVECPYKWNEAVNDIICALLPDTSGLTYGHDEKYYNNEDNLIIEVFANVATIDVMGDEYGEFSQIFSELIESYRSVVKCLN